MALNIQENVSLSDHTVYKIGGPARFYTDIKVPEDLKEAIAFAKERRIPFFVLGAGSNILVSDKGYGGLVIHLAEGGIEINSTEVSVGASLMMAQVVAKAAHTGLSGFEWAIGVPGTIGGSVRGNAGCFGHEMKDVVKAVRFFDTLSGEFKEFSNSECEFEYRHSIFKKHPEWIIMYANLGLKKGDPKEIQETIKKISLERSGKQDIGTKSCGCIFKNISWARKDVDKNYLLNRFPELQEFKDHETVPSSFLIDQTGLKGKKIGHVFVSPRHANFFVNEGGGTAEEVAILIAVVKEKIHQKYGIWLEEEIQYVGF